MKWALNAMYKPHPRISAFYIRVLENFQVTQNAPWHQEAERPLSVLGSQALNPVDAEE
jgi:hypothetical protein